MEAITENVVVAMKRRGRKPKAASTSDAAATVPKTGGSNCRSGAKNSAKCVYNAYDASSSPSNAHTSDDENVIMKLNIEPNTTFQPGAYNANQHNAFESRPCLLDSSMDIISDTVRDETAKAVVVEETQSSRNMKLLMEFEEKSKINDWPSNTSVHCFWCCSKFNTPPVGIPTKYKRGKFFVFGCFCGLSCAAAYNFDSKESLEEIWERYTMINMMSSKMFNVNVVTPSPSRLTLNIFGGPLTIQEFRAYNGEDQSIVVHFPPMVMMTQQVEEVNNKDIKSEYKYIPIDNERISKYQEKIKLRRTKPVFNFQNTLDHSMRVKYSES